MEFFYSVKNWVKAVCFVLLHGPRAVSFHLKIRCGRGRFLGRRIYFMTLAQDCV